MLDCFIASQLQCAPFHLGHRLEVDLFTTSNKDQAADEALSDSARSLLLREAEGEVDAQQRRNALVLISDDRGFLPLLRTARSSGWGTVLVSDAPPLQV